MGHNDFRPHAALFYALNVQSVVRDIGVHGLHNFREALAFLLCPACVEYGVLVMLIQCPVMAQE